YFHGLLAQAMTKPEITEVTGYIGSKKTVLHRQRSKLQLIENESRIVGVDVLTVWMHEGLYG
ncbi:hypothetical protein ACC690_38850, partial [Rhizobium johnstonii]|uniref:hypothetical protein n=1 Tax=Rhizobium johnstonii TaxID=3019933 RepID=UPI003F965392